MRKLIPCLLLALALGSLGGCAVYPVPPGPRYYAAPPPAYYAPRPYYGYRPYGYGYGYGHGWHRW